MANKSFFVKFIIGFLLFLSFQLSYSQRDSISELPVLSQRKSLQFGEYLIHEDSNYLPVTIDVLHNNFSNSENYYAYNPVRDPKRLLYNTGLFFGAAVASFSVLWVLPESVSNWDKDKMLEEGLLNRWKENVRSGPVVDDDSFFLNFIMHPYSGAVYYMSARGSGFKWWESFTYSAIMSTFFWEYGIEAFAEIPSWQDMFVTPILGSLVGEGFFALKGEIIRNDSRVLNSKFIGNTTLFIIDPFNEIVNALGYKTKSKIETYSIIAPIDYDFTQQKSIWGLQVIARF